MAQMGRLEVLSLSNNHFKTFPDSIAALSRLAVLDLSGNEMLTVCGSAFCLSFPRLAFSAVCAFR